MLSVLTHTLCFALLLTALAADAADYFPPPDTQGGGER